MTRRMWSAAGLVLPLVALTGLAWHAASPLQEFEGGLFGWARSSWSMRSQLELPVVLAGGNVIDVRTGEVRRGVDVVVKGDRILRIGGKAPRRATVHDVTGKWIVPGYVDLHAHVIPASELYPDAPDAPETLELLLDAGVTLVRCLPLFSESALSWSARVATADLVGPSIVPASGVFEKVPQRTSQGFGDAATAASWVRREALLGTRWIKVYNAMDAESLAAIVDTAAEYGMRVCGHTEDVPPREASELGIATIEHMVSIPLSCASDPAVAELGGSLAAKVAERWALVDDELASDLVDAFVANGTAWVPTLVVSEAMLDVGHDGGAAPSEEVRAGLEEALERSARLAVAMHRRGGLVGTGTDFPVDGVEPGTSLHRELELLVELGGATPLEALRMATLDSATILGAGELCGAVEEGRIADLVVLGANPLEDVAHVAEVELVLHAGRVHEPR